MNITLSVLRALAPKTPSEQLAAFVGPINAALDEFQIERVADFLAQTAHESGGFRVLEENLHYSAKRMAEVWRKRYAENPDDPPAQRRPNARAVMLANAGPEAIANDVYAHRMGNGDYASGDGWRHRGAGLIQTTGKENQTKVADYFGIPLEEVGAWMRTPEGAARSAALFWANNRCDSIFDFALQTERINGGREGLEHREALLAAAHAALDGSDWQNHTA